MGLNTSDTLRNITLGGLNTSSNLMTGTDTVAREETDGIQDIIEEVPEVQERHSQNLAELQLNLQSAIQTYQQ